VVRPKLLGTSEPCGMKTGEIHEHSSALRSQARSSAAATHLLGPPGSGPEENQLGGSGDAVLADSDCDAISATHATHPPIRAEDRDCDRDCRPGVVRGYHVSPR